jgi:SAM-dependent methyltransferase
MICRHCQCELQHLFVDLGTAPPSNAYLQQSDLNAADKFFPLRVYVCVHCWLVQTQDYALPEELFSASYAYFSSYSESWLQHAKKYVEKMVALLQLTDQSFVVEIAANDGYLLQNFVEKNIPCLGVEPTKSTAEAARKKNIPINENFFGLALAQKIVYEKGLADLLIANNVLAHVPDINNFVSAFSVLLKPNGVATFEFPYLLELVKNCQFDTIYHEHFSYFSLTAVKTILERNGLFIYDVEKLSTHGGSLRVFAQRIDIKEKPLSKRVAQFIDEENILGIKSITYYADFQARVEDVKNNFLNFLISAKEKGKKVAGYGAAAKGNTLLNFSGVRGDLVSYIVDKNIAKQGCYMPGSRIPIVSEERIKEDRPDYVIIFPWNLRDEVMNQLSFIKEWGSSFVTVIPMLQVYTLRT